MDITSASPSVARSRTCQQMDRDDAQDARYSRDATAPSGTSESGCQMRAEERIAEDHLPAHVVAVPSTPSNIDRTICQLIAANDCRAALEILMDEYGEVVHRYCVSFLARATGAEDLVQDVFLDAFLALPRFQLTTGCRAWVLAIARHRCIDEARKTTRWRKVLHESDKDGPPDAVVPDSPPGSEGGVDVPLEQCLDRLSPVGREVVNLRYRQELSYDEIAAVTGASAATLRVRALRALEALRRCLEKKGIGPK